MAVLGTQDSTKYKAAARQLQSILEKYGYSDVAKITVFIRNNRTNVPWDGVFDFLEGAFVEVCSSDTSRI